MSAKPHREIEIKLRVDGIPCTPADVRRIAKGSGVRLQKAHPVDQDDTYLDDAAYHLTRAGVALRVRATATGRVLCVKAERDVREGMFERDELELPLDGPLPGRASDLPAAMRDRVEPFVLGADLLPIARLHTARCVLRGAKLEVAIDAVEVGDGAGSRLGDFAEVEIEIAGDEQREAGRALAEALRAELGLVDASRNKLERALEMRRIAIDADEPGPITPDLPVHEAARRVIARHFRRMQREEARVRTTDAPEGTHKLRVACRRLRAAVRTFATWLTPKQRRAFGDALRATSRAFGTARDLDVLAAEFVARRDRLPGALHEPADRVILQLRALGEDARRAGRDVLRDPDRIAALARLARFVDEPATGGDGRTVREAAPTLIREAAERALAQGRTLDARSPATAVHELRILMKRLRYTAECFVETYGKDLVRFVERATHLQEILGEFNDAAVAVEVLRRFAKTVRGLRRGELLAIGALMAIEHLRGAAARRRFDEVWAEFDSDDLRTWLEAVLRTPVGG